MDPRKLKYFVAVAEELHFSRAAARLNVAQPALSRSIKMLEDEIGVVLLTRTRRNVKLTPAGQALLHEGKKMLNQAEFVQTLVKRVGTAETERLNISLIGPALYRFLPGVLAFFRKRHPAIEIVLQEKDSYAQMEGVLGGSIDAGFVYNVVELGDACDRMIVEQATVVVAVHSESRLARRTSVRLNDLAEEAFIFSPHAVSPTRISNVMAACRSAGFTPRIVQYATQTNTQLSLVSAGLGSAFVTATAALITPPNIVFLPVTDMPLLTRYELMMIWQAHREHRPLSLFVEAVEDYVRLNPDLMRLRVDPGTG